MEAWLNLIREYIELNSWVNFMIWFAIGGIFAYFEYRYVEKMRSELSEEEFKEFDKRYQFRNGPWGW